MRHSATVIALRLSWWAMAGFVTLMIAVAVSTSARRVSTVRRGWPVVVPIVAGALPLAAGVVAPVRRR
jgi:putative ABC transport system permease protein